MWHAGTTIVREEGVRALYKGLVASWLGSVHVAIYFPTYEHLRGWVAAADAAASERDSTATTLLASTLAKLIASSVTYPHEVVRARLQDQQQLRVALPMSAAAAPSPPAAVYTGIWDCARRIWAAEGVGGLYAGFSANLLRTLPATAITFVCFEKAIVFAAKRRELISAADLLDETALR